MFRHARTLPRDGSLLFATRLARLFAYGFLSIVLALYLSELGLSPAWIGGIFSATLIGDALVSLWITARADRVGRRRMLVLGALLMLFAGGVYAGLRAPILLAIAGTLGVLSPSGNEIGPFLAIEQACLAQILPDDRRTSVFAWYNLVGSFATALGALAGGVAVQVLQAAGLSALSSYRWVLVAYAVTGLGLAALFLALSPAVEAPAATARGEHTGGRSFLGLDRSRGIVLGLAALFSLDALGGGFVVQSLVSWWFQRRFDLEPAVLGTLFFAANVLAGVSALSAAWIAKRIGLIRTMVFTHLPSNVLLMAVPLMPSLGLAIAVLLARFSISQMDVPTRQSYVMAVVEPHERSAAAGVTGIARSVGASLSPSIAGALLGASLGQVAFFLAGGLKIVYDLLLYRAFRSVRPPEERTGGRDEASLQG